MGGNYKGKQRVHFLIYSPINCHFTNISLILVLGVGNATASAEFNFHQDPEAAHIVLNTLDCPIIIVPWECCTKDVINISKVLKSLHSQIYPIF